VQQIKTMQALCRELEVSPLIGSFDISHQRASSGRIWLDMCDISNCSGVPDGSGEEVYTRLISDFGSRLLIISGAPMKCMGQFFGAHPDAKIDLWVAQGGFAGDCVVPPEFRLSKFRGMNECHTFNFGGCTKTMDLLQNPNIVKKILVSKNVCHGVIFTREVLDMYSPTDNRGLNFIYEGMRKYLSRKAEKKFHDPLACVVALHEIINLDHLLHFEQVEMYKVSGKYGCIKARGTNTFISTGMKSMDEFWKFFWQL
jgi:pyrimidine-specific ribonucleoside hydrolase